EVDAISHLPPAIAIEQRNRVTNARSTVGTTTEILDLLRLLWARAGEVRCTRCGLPAAPGDAAAVADRILARAAGRRASLGVAFATAKRESATALRERLLRDGWSRLLDTEGRAVELEPLTPRQLNALREGALVLIDRLAPREAERGRLVEAVANAFARGDGEVVVV